MAHELKWNSQQPGHIVYLIDLSGSMKNKINDVAYVLKESLDALIGRCQTISGEPAERVSISVYGYNCKTYPLLSNPPISVAEIGALIGESERQERPLFNAITEYQTEMQKAFETAIKDVNEWIDRQKKAGMTNIPSPIVINITDGFPYEGPDKDQENVFERTLNAAKKLTSISTNDGNIRLFNIHFDPQTKNKTIRFPEQRPVERTLQFMFDASSPMEPDMFTLAKRYFPEATFNSKCMISNEKDLEALFNFIDWGSTK